MELNNFKLMPITDLCREHKLSKYSVYTLIKTDPTFPCINIGPKKNYRIPIDLFKDWLQQRLITRKTLQFQVPTVDQLLQVGKK